MKEAIKDAYDAVLAAYEAVGYPAEVVNSWAISTNDVEPFGRLLIEADPVNILEVGTYVGVSTLLMAKLAPKARIVTVDPNFPLKVEMGAANSFMGAVDSRLKTQEIGKRAAKHLGVGKQIKWIEGGFSIGDTFSSVLRDVADRVPVVGPRVCEQFGPFDFVFVDGLHTANAVANDLALAGRWTTPEGRITLHDCVGFWGSNVRAGIFDFLDQHPEYRFSHPQFAAQYESVGLIRRRDQPRLAYERVRSPLSDDSRSTDVAVFLSNVAARALGTEGLCELYLSAPAVLPALASQGIAIPAATLRSARAKGAGSDITRKSLDEALKTLANAGRCNGIAAIDVLDFLDDGGVASLFTALKAKGLPAFFCGTPPGEQDATGPHSRPLARIVALASQAGMSVFGISMMDLEPAKYAMLPDEQPLSGSSMLTHAFVVAPTEAFIDASGQALIRYSHESAREREQVELYRTHLSQGYRNNFERAERMSALVRSVQTRTAELEEEYRSLITHLEAQAAEAAETYTRQSAELGGQISESSRRLAEIEAASARASEQAAAAQEALAQASVTRLVDVETQRRLTAEIDGLHQRAAVFAAELNTEKSVEANLREDMARLGRNAEIAEARLAEHAASREDMLAVVQQIRAAGQDVENRLEAERLKTLSVHNELADAKATARELRERLEQQGALAVEVDARFAEWRGNSDLAADRLVSEVASLRDALEGSRRALADQQAGAAVRLEAAEAAKDKVIEALRQTLLEREQARLGELGRLQTEHSEALARLYGDYEQHRASLHEEMRSLSAEHERRLETVHGSTAEREAALRAEYQAKLDAREADLAAAALNSAQHEQDLRKEFEQALSKQETLLETARLEAAERERNHVKDLAAAAAEHEKTLKSARLELAAREAEFMADAAALRTRTETQLEEARREFVERTQSHQKDLLAATAVHEQALTAMRAEYTGREAELRAETEVQRTRTAARLEEAWRESTDRERSHQKELAAAAAAHEQALRSARQEFDNLGAELRAEIDLQRDRAETRLESAAKDTRIREQELRQDFEGALVERETRLEAMRQQAAAREAELRTEIEVQRARAEAKLEEASAHARTREEKSQEEAYERQAALQSQLVANASAYADRLEAIQAEVALAEAALKQQAGAQIAAIERRMEVAVAERTLEIEQLRTERDHALSEREIILKSNAWRATAPLRRTLSFVLRRKRPPKS